MIRSSGRVALLLAVAALPLVSARVAQAQTEPRSGSRVDVFVSVGWGRVWRYEGRAYGSGLNIGTGVTIRVSSGWGIGLETDWTIGPRSAPVVVCVNASYRFRSDRQVQPYLSAGIGALWTRHDRRAGDTRSPGTEVGFGPNLGAGLRLADSGGPFFQADISWIEGAWLSPANLSVTRMSVAAGRSLPPPSSAAHSSRMPASGLMEVARCAGRMQAASATVTITATAIAMLAASVAVSPNSRSAMTLASAARRRQRRACRPPVPGRRRPSFRAGTRE